MPRYLYADSEPFPHTYDFLSTFRGFVTCAARCLTAISAIDRHRKQLEEERQRVDTDTSALLDFAQNVEEQIELALARAQNPSAVDELARNLQEHVVDSTAATKSRWDSGVRSLEDRLQIDINKCRDDIADALREFFLDHQLDLVSSRFRVELVETGYTAMAVCSFPLGVDVSYRLEASRVERWQHPMKISDLLGELELQIGMRKKFLSRDMTRQFVRLDEHVISWAELDPEHLQLRLRRKAEGPDQFMLRMTKHNGAVNIEIVRLGEKDDPAPLPAANEDVRKLEELWHQVADTNQNILGLRERVVSATVDAGDMFLERHAAEFIDRYVEMFAPEIDEIARRSPSRKELSLKLEHADGRREELYLRKDELLDLVGVLDDRKMKVFEPLDLFPVLEVELE